MNKCKCGSNNIEIVKSELQGREVHHAVCASCGRRTQTTPYGEKFAEELWNSNHCY